MSDVSDASKTFRLAKTGRCMHTDTDTYVKTKVFKVSFGISPALLSFSVPCGDHAVSFSTRICIRAPDTARQPRFGHDNCGIIDAERVQMADFHGPEYRPHRLSRRSGPGSNDSPLLRSRRALVLVDIHIKPRMETGFICKYLVHTVPVGAWRISCLASPDYHAWDQG